MFKKGFIVAILGISINLILAIVKGLTGYLGHSYALIADATESGLDVFSSIIVLIGLKISSRAPDGNHPYGHGKAEPITAIVVVFFLTGAAGLIIFQSIQHIQTPHKLPELFTLPVLAFVILIKEALFRYGSKISNELHSTAVKAEALHHRSDAITSFMAMLGISIALIGGKGYETADDWAALAASAFILWNAYKMLRESLAEIMDEAPPTDLITEIREAALTVFGVKGLDKSRARKMGLNYYVDLHIIVDGKITVQEGHTIAHKVKETLLKAFPNVSDVLIHVEPD